MSRETRADTLAFLRRQTQYLPPLAKRRVGEEQHKLGLLLDALVLEQLHHLLRALAAEVGAHILNARGALLACFGG